MIDKIFEKRKEQIELIINLPRAELVKLLQECPHEALNCLVAGQEEEEIKSDDEELKNREEELKKIRERLVEIEKQIRSDLESPTQTYEKPTFEEPNNLSTKQREQYYIIEIVKAHSNISLSQKELNGLVFQTGNLVDRITKKRSNITKYLDKLHNTVSNFPSRQTCYKYKKYYLFVKDYLSFLDCDYPYNKIIDYAEGFKRILDNPETSQDKNLAKFFKNYSNTKKVSINSNVEETLEEAADINDEMEIMNISDNASTSKTTKPKKKAN